MFYHSSVGKKNLKVISVTLFLLHSWGVDFPIPVELELLLKLNRYSYHTWCEWAFNSIVGLITGDKIMTCLHMRLVYIGPFGPLDVSIRFKQLSETSLTEKVVWGKFHVKI